MATHTITPSRIAYLYDTHNLSVHSYPKILLAFTLPAEVKAKTPSAASLNLYQSGANANSLISVLGKTSTATGWAVTYGAASLEALALSGTLSTSTIPNSTGAWRSFNVLGSVSEGVREACEQSRTEITVVLHKTGLQTPEFALGGALILGSDDDDTVCQFTDSGANGPYLSITVPDTGIGPVVHSASGGAGAMF